MTEALVSDVKGVIDTGLSDSDIQNYIDDAAFDIDHNVSESLTTAHRGQLEKHLAALKIVQSKEPAVGRDSVGDSTMEYDADTVSWLKGQVHDLDPSGQLASNVRRDTDRYVTSGTPGSET